MTVTRRQMLTTGGVVAGASIFPLTKIVEAQRPARIEEKLLQHVGQEFARFVRLARAGRLRSAHMLSLAGTVRVWALGVPDVELKAAAAKQKAAGNFSLHDHAQHTRSAAEVKKFFGLDIAAEQALLPPVQPADATAALDTIIREGLSPSLQKMADGLEQQAAQMAARERDGRQLVQYSPGSPYCAYYPHLLQSVVITCAWSFLFALAGQLACAVGSTWTVVWYYVCS